MENENKNNETMDTQEPEVEETENEAVEEQDNSPSFTQRLMNELESIFLILFGAAIAVAIIFFHSAFKPAPHELPSAQTVRELAAEALKDEPLKEYVMKQIIDCIDHNDRYVCDMSYSWVDEDDMELTFRFYLDGMECPCGSGMLTPPKIVELSIWQSDSGGKEWKISSSDVKITYIEGYIEELYKQAAAGYTIHSDPFTKG